MKNGLQRWMSMFSPLNIRFTTGWEMQRWNVQTHLDNLLRVANHAAQEAPGVQKQAAVVVILVDHRRGELWKRKPN